MKASKPLLIMFVVLMVVGSCFSCDGSGRAANKGELARVNRAVADYDARMNAEQFGQIWDAMLPIARGTREGSYEYLSWIHQKYGSIVRSQPIRAIANYEFKDQPIAIECWYETEGEKGKYVDKFVWHLLDAETKLAMHDLLEYDEHGQLYMTMT